MLGAKQRCCPIIPQTWIALGWFLVALLIMAIFQQYPDSLPNYPAECGPLQDLGFRIIPYVMLNWLSDSAWQNIADVWVLVSLALFLVIALFTLQQPQLVLRRFLLLLGLLYLQRAIVVPLTRYPRLPQKSDNYVAPNFFVGALLLITGVHSTATDIMPSGHTMVWILTAWMVSRYSYFAPPHLLYWLFNFTGLFFLLAVREHYFADIVVSILLTFWTFAAYHLLLDNLTRRFFHVGLEVEPTRMIPGVGMPLYLPLRLQDGEGELHEVSVPLGVTRIRENTVLLAPVKPIFQRMHRWWKWLDGGE